MSATAVLYDAPGPKAKRRQAIFGTLSGLILLGVLVAVILRLADRGQLTMEKWGGLINPSDERFSQVWDNFLIPGLRDTFRAAVLSIILSVAVGTFIGVARLMLGKYARIPVVTFIELFRGLPVVVSILFVSRVFPAIDLRLDFMPGGEGLWYLVIALVAYNSVIMAEILRAGVAALPRGQREAGLAIGLTPAQTMFQIQLPQATRLMLPALISQVVVILKDTSLAGLLAVYLELLGQGKVLAETLKANLPVYLFIGFMFIIINMALSYFAGWLERRMARGRKAPTDAHVPDLTEIDAPGTA